MHLVEGFQIFQRIIPTWWRNPNNEVWEEIFEHNFKILVEIPKLAEIVREIINNQ